MEESLLETENCWLNVSWYGGLNGCYTYPSEKYESVGMMTFPIYGKIKFMFQTTKQFGRLQSQTHCAVKRWDACLSAPKDKASGCQLAIFHTMAASKIRRHIHMILAKEKAGNSGDVTQRVEFLFTNRYDFQMSV